MKILIIIISILPSISFSQQNINSNFIYIKGGKYKPGNGKQKDEQSNKKFKIHSFYINKYETTNQEYCDFLNAISLSEEKVNTYINLNGKWRDIECGIYIKDSIYFVKKDYKNKPVFFISWYGADAFCKFHNLRLLSEIEWEYAAKSENFQKKTHLPNQIIENYAWFIENSNNKIHNCGTKNADINGIYDMIGNVSEWCNDWYSEDSYKKAKRRKPRGPSKGKFKVHRGGSWANTKEIIKATNRRASNPNTQNATIGFRTAKNILE